MQGYVDPGKIPFKVQAMAVALREHGGRPFIVGGSVRDVLLGRAPSDWDIAVNMEPEQILGVFPGACTVGIEFGRVSVGDVDVVSLRAEKDYADRRHPGQVFFGVTLGKDLERRDFTINAMAWDPFTGEIFDPFGGLIDLENKTIASVGEPLVRFEEDPLRILRAVRLRNSLGFNFDPDVTQAIRDAHNLLSKIPGERLFTEIKRILLSPSVYQGIMDMYDYDISTVILPEINRAPDAIARAVSACRSDLAARLAVLVGGPGLPVSEVSKQVNRLKHRFNLPVSLVQDVQWLVYNCGPDIILNEQSLPKAHRRLWKQWDGYKSDPVYVARLIVHHWGIRQFERLIDVKHAIWLGFGNGGFPKAYLHLVAGLWAIQESNIQEIGVVAVNGTDVMQLLNIEEGHIVGDALEYLEEMVLRYPELNQKKALSEILLKWWDKQT